MSTTAMQAAGQHIPTSSYQNPPSSRQYAQQHSGNDETYYLSHTTPDSSSSHSSRQQRRHQNTQSTSQRNVYPDREDDHALQAPTHYATTTMTSYDNDQSISADQYDGAPVPPPRSSSQQNSPNTARSTSKHARHNTERSAGPDPNLAGNYNDSTRDRSREDTSATASNTARPRRNVPTSPEGVSHTTDSRDRAAQPGYTSHTRSESTMQSSGLPAPLLRENSEVLNRIVVSDPQVDIERLQQRVAEAQAGGITADQLQATVPQEEEPTRGPQRRQDYSKSTSRRKDVQFGDYVLGQTLGEGEFGKVKLGWKKDGSTQVAIKLIRRESVATNPTRLPKIYREISILRDLAHPNIVRLHEMVETERHIGIILEYASGGELFDYILNQRYLKDPSARRLFAQLISGVGYLHKKGIVHRDLKLENLLLDQNKNIIITDFGFANTFNPGDDLSPEIEYNLSSKDFVRKYKLDRLDANGMRKGDLMQTSCGSPCYAAPELVVSDSLYTGRKVDVWSCGVILYAMLAGYLPFDDDPANPEGDNINLLYKYITTTPLIFPEYVSPHARDLLRRILVPDPRKRADLFEVARHSWLNEYHQVVAHITSSTTNIAEIANSTVPAEGQEGSSLLPRSASVRTPKTASPRVVPQTVEATPGSFVDEKRERTNRHTLQPEYVAPQTETMRGASEQTTKRSESQAVSAIPAGYVQKQLPPDPPRGVSDNMVPTQTGIPVRPARDIPRSTSENPGSFGIGSGSQGVTHYATRPSTQGSLTSAGGHHTTRSDLRLPSRGSYGQPVAPTVAATNVEGRVTQPAKPVRGYNIPGPVTQQHSHHASIGQPTTQSMPPPQQPSSDQQRPAHHRRSSTLSNLGERLFGRSSSVSRKEEQKQKGGSRKYPPTSMKDPYSNEPQPRMSTDSKRSFTFGLKKKESSDMQGSEEKSRRFSLIPSSMSFKGLLGGSRDPLTENQSQSMTSSQQSNRPPTGQGYGSGSNDGQQDKRFNNFSRPPQAQSRHGYQSSTGDVYGGTGVYNSDMPQNQSQGGPSHQRQDSRQNFQQYSTDGYDSRTSMQQNRPGRNVLSKPNRNFNGAYDTESGGHASSGAVRKVQDFFRRRGRARMDSEYR